MIKRPAKSASKDSLFAAFDQLNAEYKKLEAALKSRPEEPSTVNEIHVSTASTPTDGASGAASVEAVITSLLALKNDFGAAVSSLSARLTAEATRLGAQRQQAEEIVAQLRELHGLEVGDDTLQTVIREYQSKSEEFQKELKEKREAFEKLIAERQAAWQAEQEEHSRAVKERDETLKKAQRRGNEEYDYDLAQRRKAEADTWDQERLGAQKELDDAIAAREKQWAEREKVVAEQEKLYADYKAKFDELQTRLSEATRKAKNEGQGIANAQAKIKSDLIAKEVEGEKRVHDLQIKQLEASIADRAKRIEALSAQLAAALKQGQELAVKAIEGASNAQSFGAVKEIALEQAKNLPKAK